MKAEYVLELKHGGGDWQRKSELPFIPPIGLIMEFSNPVDSDSPLWLCVKFVVWEEAFQTLHIHLEAYEGMIIDDDVKWLRKYGFSPCRILTDREPVKGS